MRNSSMSFPLIVIATLAWTIMRSMALNVKTLDSFLVRIRQAQQGRPLGEAVAIATYPLGLVPVCVPRAPRATATVPGPPWLIAAGRQPAIAKVNGLCIQGPRAREGPRPARWPDDTAAMKPLRAKGGTAPGASRN